MKRKFFSILTALALCLTLLPTAVWAEEADAAVQEEGPYALPLRRRYLHRNWPYLHREDHLYCVDVQ